MGIQNPDGTKWQYEGPLISAIHGIYDSWKNGKIRAISEGQYQTLQAFHKAIGGTQEAIKVLHITEAEYEAFFPRP